MTDYHKFEEIRDSILRFREEKSQNRGQYKRFVNDIWENAILEIHKDTITKLSQSQKTFDVFLITLLCYVKKQLMKTTGVLESKLVLICGWHHKIAKPAEPVNDQDERRILCAAVDSPACLC